jgi:hypothetical protein
MSPSNIDPKIFAVLALALFTLSASGCSTQTGQYAPTKQQWDSPRSGQVEDELRNRLALTQRDH